jgi:hypothetical protein
MIDLGVRCDRLLAALEAQQGRRQHRRRCDQPQRVRQRLAVRQLRHAGAHGAVDVKRRQKRQRRLEPLEHLDASFAQSCRQFRIAGQIVEEAIQQQAHHLRVAPAAGEFR